MAMFLRLLAMPVVNLPTLTPQAAWIDKALGTSQAQANQC